MEFGILGPLVVTTEEGELAVGAAKARSVLGLLVLRANQVVSTEQLIDALWEDNPPRSAVTTVQTYVYQLRKNLQLDALRTQPTGYRLEVSRRAVDALRFEDVMQTVTGGSVATPDTVVNELTEALRWWRGPALAGFEGAAWARGEATRLELLRLDATERLIDARLALGEHAAVAPELEALVEAYPLRERFWAQLMLALYRSGRQADALRAYSRLRERLRDELGVEPGRDVVELEAAILSHAPELALPAHVPPQHPEGEPEERASTKRAAPRRTRMLLALGISAVIIASVSVALGRSEGGTSRPTASPARYEPRYRSVSCRADLVPGPGDSSLRCGILTVPEDRQRPAGRTIELGVFRYPTAAEHPADDPVVQVGSVFRVPVAPSDTELRGRSDSIYLAGRGFFGSKPRLTCPEVTTALVASLARPLRDPVNTKEFLGAAGNCHERWIGLGVDLDAYSAAARADDVRDLARALNLERINLVAAGPATRDAREVAGRHPGLVRSITLFNVVPPDANPWNGAITNAAAALDRYFGECANQPASAATYPHLRQRLIDVVDRAKRGPQIYESANPYREAREPVRILLDGDRAMQLVLRALDDPTALALIPVAVASPATSGQATADYTATSLIVPEDASWGALFSRVCIDETADLGLAGVRLEAQAEPHLAFLAEDPLLEICGVWKTPAARSHAPGPSSTPTLILEGELDPFTSRQWAAQTAASFGRATVVQLPHLGGVASSGDPCVARLRAGFLADPMRPVAASSCARSIAPVHFAGS